MWRKSDKEVVISSLLLLSLESPCLSENAVKKTMPKIEYIKYNQRTKIIKGEQMYKPSHVLCFVFFNAAKTGP